MDGLMAGNVVPIKVWQNLTYLCVVICAIAGVPRHRPKWYRMSRKSSLGLGHAKYDLPCWEMHSRLRSWRDVCHQLLPSLSSQSGPLVLVPSWPSPQRIGLFHALKLTVRAAWARPRTTLAFRTALGRPRAPHPWGTPRPASSYSTKQGRQLGVSRGPSPFLSILMLLLPF